MSCPIRRRRSTSLSPAGQIEALDDLPRPTLVTCRTGPRSSALISLYAGLRDGASADDVFAHAEADGAAFVSPTSYAGVADGLEQLSDAARSRSQRSV